MSTDLPTLTPGAVVAGRFRIEEKIGEGGFGAVFRATQLNLERQVALKVLQPSLVAHDESIARFYREAKLAQRLEHPNTVRLFDFGRGDDGLPFIAWELLKGRPLEALLRRGPLLPARVARIASQVLKSLMEAHSLGVVHRDIKPANIFICNFSGEPDFVKVLDFGIAKALHQDGSPSVTAAALTQVGHTLGTLSYMAPEQALGRAIGPAADLYALGLVMSEMLTGELVMKAESEIEIYRQHLSPSPVSLPPGVLQSPLGAVIHRATQKAPERRHESAAEMLRDLEAAAGMGAASVPALAPNPGPPTVPASPLAYMPTGALAPGLAGAYPPAPWASRPLASHPPAAGGYPAMPPPYGGYPAQGGPMIPAYPAPRVKGASGCSPAIIALVVVCSLGAGLVILSLVFWSARSSVNAPNDDDDPEPASGSGVQLDGRRFRDFTAEDLSRRAQAGGYETLSKSTTEGQNFSMVSCTVKRSTTTGAVQLLRYADATTAASAETSYLQNGSLVVARDDNALLIVMMFPANASASRELLDELTR
jgi:hypothetical protein